TRWPRLAGSPTGSRPGSVARTPVAPSAPRSPLLLLEPLDGPFGAQAVVRGRGVLRHGRHPGVDALLRDLLQPLHARQVALRRRQVLRVIRLRLGLRPEPAPRPDVEPLLRAEPFVVVLLEALVRPLRRLEQRPGEGGGPRLVLTVQRRGPPQQEQQ